MFECEMVEVLFTCSLSSWCLPFIRKRLNLIKSETIKKLKNVKILKILKIVKIVRIYLKKWNFEKVDILKNCFIKKNKCIEKKDATKARRHVS